MTTLSNFSWLGGTGGARPRVVELRGGTLALVEISGPNLWSNLRFLAKRLRPFCRTQKCVER